MDREDARERAEKREEETNDMPSEIMDTEAGISAGEGGTDGMSAGGGRTSGISAGPACLKQIFRPTDCLFPPEEDFRTGIFGEGLPGSVFSSGFAGDKDVIIFSRPFRRLQDKTQIYPGEMNDHYRTRLTHSLEVAHIAELMARLLDADADLTAAIALGHDLGHTPFGHRGERVLHEIMSGRENNLLPEQLPLNLGGFRHNYHGVRLLDLIETHRVGVYGRNLCWQTLEGILKHTKTNGEQYDLSRFIHPERDPSCLFPETDFSVTLEGQIVAAADEIAQRQQDLDDAAKNKETKLSSENIRDQLIRISGKILDRHEKDHDNERPLLFLRKLHDDLERTKQDRSLFLGDHLIRCLTEYYVSDVCFEAKRRCQEEGELTRQTFVQINKDRRMPGEGCACTVLCRKIADLSAVGKETDDLLKKWIGCRISVASDVNIFDERAENVIRQLFRSLYKNPLQLPGYERTRLEMFLKRNAEIYDIGFKNEGVIFGTDDGDGDDIGETGKTVFQSQISLRNSSGAAFRRLTDIMKLRISADEVVIPENVDVSVFSDVSYLNSILKMSVPEMKEEERFVRACLENNFALLSVICTYIAGMTDNYAVREFRKFFIPG